MRCSMLRSTVALWVTVLMIVLVVAPAYALRLRGDHPSSSTQLSRANLMVELAGIRHRWPHMNATERREAAAVYLPDPVGDNRKSAAGLAKIEQSTAVSGATIVKTANCRIIFGTNYISYINKGGNAYSLGYWSDGDGDGMPKFIELLAGGDPKVAESLDGFQNNTTGIMEVVWANEITKMGFAPPPGTDSVFLDIYIANTGVKNPAVDFNGAKGITLPSTVYGVTATYQNGQPYMILSQDMVSGLIPATAAHEFFHAVQTGYVDYDTMLADSTVNWLAESSASWMEDAVYPLVNDYATYVWQLTASPQWSLFDPDLVYAAVLFQKYLTEYYHAPGDPDGSEVVKALWDGMAQGKGLISSLESFLAGQSANPRHTLAEAYADFAVKNLDLVANYQDGALYDPVTVTKTGSIDPELTPVWSDSVAGYWQAPSHYGSTYLKVTVKNGSLDGLANRLRVDFSGGQQSRWRLQLVPVSAAGVLGQAVSLDLAAGAGGQVVKEDNELYTTAYVVASALPLPEGILDVATVYGYDYTVNAYLATRLAKGWNLQHVSNAGLQTFGNGLSHIVSAWRWTGGSAPTWEVAFPNAAPEVLDAYVNAKGLAKLTAINQDDGVWLNVDTPGVEEVKADAAIPQTLIVDSGWNLLSSYAPANVPVGSLAGGQQGMMTFWKWDALAGRWAFYSSAMDSQSLAAYVASKGFSLLSFIGYGEGFWVHSDVPATLALQ